MNYLWAILLIVANTGWLGLVLVGLPGNWLMIISAGLLDWWTGGTMFSRWTLLFAVALAVLGELAEFAAGLVGARRAGGSRAGAGGALLGGLVGGIVGTFAIPIPVLGSILGACGGAFAGAMGMELAIGRGVDASIRSGLGAGQGRFFGTVSKLVIGVAIWVLLAAGALWP
jgi:uncharacterized protein